MNTVRAAVEGRPGKLYFFSGNEYVRYDIRTDRAEDGWPKRIADQWRGLFERDIDAAINWGDGKAYFFKGDLYSRYDMSPGVDKVENGWPKRIASEWRGLFERDIDAAVNWGNGKAYFFKGDLYSRYDMSPGIDRVEDGWPKRIADHWPGLFERDIDAAANLGNGKALFFKGSDCIQWDIVLNRVDPGFPRPIPRRWLGPPGGGLGVGALSQGVSHVDPFSADGVIGQIFFPTNGAAIDEQDAEELNKIPPAYLPLLNAPGAPVEFRFRGFADHRPTTQFGNNLGLSEARANSVKLFLQDRFFNHPQFAPIVQAFGVHPQSVSTGAPSSVALSEFRRVDIIARPAKRFNTAKPNNAPQCRSSREFRIKLGASGSVGKFGLNAEVLLAQIHDLTNQRGMSFEYVGVGPGVGLGLASVSAGTDFVDFTTTVPVCLEDFEGPAAHTGALIAAVTGVSFDFLDLLGPFHRRGAEPVLLEFPISMSAPGVNAGVSAGHSRGNLSPINAGFPLP